VAQAQAEPAQEAAIAATMAAANPPLPPPIALLVPIPPDVGLQAPVIIPAMIVPPSQADPRGAFLHLLEHIIRLDTQAKRDSMKITAGCVTLDKFLHLETEILIN
jgi:hypothetical protein